MIYKVKENYIGSDSFFFIGEVFEGSENPAVDGVYSSSETGEQKLPGFGISRIAVERLGKTWQEVRRKYPEEFL